MYGHPFHFEGDGAGVFNIARNFYPAQTFPNMCKSSGMPNYCITGNRFGKCCKLREFFLFQKLFFDSTVLKSKLNFEMKDLLAIADKPEMPRFNHPCMDWANANFVQLIAVNGKEWIISNGFRLVSPVFGVTYRF